MGTSIPDERDRLAAYAATIGGFCWLLVTGHAYLAHGFTEVNEMNLVLGFTWMDGGKLLVLFPLLLVPAVRAVRHRAELSRVGRVGYAITLVALAGSVITGVVEFWVFPWGSYALTFEASSTARAAGFLRTLSTLAFAVGIGVFGASLARKEIVRLWVPAVAALSVVSAVFIIPNPLPAVAWFAFGFEAWAPKRAD